MRVRIWIDDWQMECCGKPFAVGQDVVWSVSRLVDTQRLARMVSAAPTIDYVEDHHELQADTRTIGGSVSSVFAAYVRFDRDPVSDVPSPVAGTEVLRPLERTRRFEPRRADVEFVGYLVELDVP